MALGHTDRHYPESPPLPPTTSAAFLRKPHWVLLLLMWISGQEFGKSLKQVITSQLHIREGGGSPKCGVKLTPQRWGVSVRREKTATFSAAASSVAPNAHLTHGRGWTGQGICVLFPPSFTGVDWGVQWKPWVIIQPRAFSAGIAHLNPLWNSLLMQGPPQQFRLSALV